MKNKNEKPKVTINPSQGSFDVAICSKDVELENLNEELNEHYMKKLR